MARQDKTREEEGNAGQGMARTREVDARKIRQDKAWQAKTTHDTRQDTKTRHQDKTRQHTNTKARARHHQGRPTRRAKP